MKIIIAGCRDIIGRVSFNLVTYAMAECKFRPVLEVVCGMAPGIDMAGHWWANRNKIPVKQFPADWKTHGKFAGPRRNYEMARYADALVAIWDGESKGTANMIGAMKKLKKPVFVVRTDEVLLEIERISGYAPDDARN